MLTSSFGFVWHTENVAGTYGLHSILRCSSSRNQPHNLHLCDCAPKYICTESAIGAHLALSEHIRALLQMSLQAAGSHTNGCNLAKNETTTIATTATTNKCPSKTVGKKIIRSQIIIQYETVNHSLHFDRFTFWMWFPFEKLAFMNCRFILIHLFIMFRVIWKSSTNWIAAFIELIMPCHQVDRFVEWHLCYKIPTNSFGSEITKYYVCLFVRLLFCFALIVALKFIFYTIRE